MSNNNNEMKIEKKQMKGDLKKRKVSSIDQRPKEQPKVENQPKNTIRNFEKLFITEKDSFTKSQKNFFEPNRIKIGER